MLLMLALLLVLAAAPMSPVCAEESPVPAQVPSVTLTIGETDLAVVLEDNETAAALGALLPMTLEMRELNGNERYVYLDAPLPSQPERVGRVEAGDLMLYGDDCIVLFFKSFDTSYRYTRIGHVASAETLADTLGQDRLVTVTFSFGDDQGDE